MLEILQNVLNTFGSMVFVPIMLFFVAKILKTPTQKALMSALMAGVALCGFSYVTGGYGGYLSNVVSTLVSDTGINLPAQDLGWQATAAMAYSTNVGMIYVGLGLALQFILYFVGWTPVFMPTDLWNNYSFIIWGSFVYIETGSIWLSLGCMILQNLYVLVYAEMFQKRWATYFGYPGTAMTAPHHVANLPFYLALDKLWNLIGLDKVNLRPETIQKKLGFLGDPMTIGFISGLLIGIVGKLYHLTELAAWGSILQFAIATAATMAIFPKVGSIFAQAFGALTESSRNIAKKGGKNKEIYIAVNDALGYGEAADLTTGLLMIPISLLLSFFLPGNIVLPIISMTSYPYRAIIPCGLSDGNILKSTLSLSVFTIVMLYCATYTAPLFTQVANDVGVGMGENVLLCGLIAAMPGMFIIYWPFLKKNYILIAVLLVVYVVLYVWYKKNKPAVDEYIEKTAVEYKGKVQEA